MGYEEWGSHRLPVVWRNGTFRYLESPGVSLGINDLGEVTGFSPFKRTRTSQATRWGAKGNRILLGNPPGAGSRRSATGRYINNNGWVAGEYTHDRMGDGRAAVWRGGQIFEIPLLGGRGVRTGAAAIDDNNIVVGSESDRESGQADGWWWNERDGIRPLPINLADDINTHNVVCGARGRMAVIYESGQVRELSRGAAYHINDRGDCLGKASGDDPLSGGVVIWIQGRRFDVLESIVPEDRFLIQELRLTLDMNNEGNLLIEGLDHTMQSQYYYLKPI